MSRGFQIIAALLAATLLQVDSVAAQINAKDHPLVSRFQGSDALEYKSTEFDEFEFPLGPIVAENSFTKSQHLEGGRRNRRLHLPGERRSIDCRRCSRCRNCCRYPRRRE